MSKNGGYRILDFKGKSLTSGSKDTTFTNLYDEIEGTNKRVIVSGLVVGTTEYDDMEVTFISSASHYYGTVTLYDSGSITIDVETTGVTVTVV